MWSLYNVNEFSIVIHNDLTGFDKIEFYQTSCAIFRPGLQATHLVFVWLPGAGGHIVGDLWMRAMSYDTLECLFVCCLLQDNNIKASLPLEYTQEQYDNEDRKWVNFSHQLHCQINHI